MENFLLSISSNFNCVTNCINQDDRAFLLQNIPPLIHNFMLFLRFSKNNLCDNNVNHILSDIVIALHNKLRECDRFLSRTSEQTNDEINLPVFRQGAVGRPKLHAPVSQITLLRHAGLSWSKISRFFNVGRVTLWNMRNRYQIEDSRPNSNISDDELLRTINNIKTDHPQAGYRYVWGNLKAHGISVSWHRLISLLRTVDPVGILARRRRRLRRRQYKVKAANYMWHMDANEKLVGWNFYLHGCTDGFSRRIMYLQVALTKDAETVLSFFQKGVEENGLPMRVRGDRGTENVKVIDYMHQERADIRNPFILGRSVHNTRIERLWGEVNRIVSSKFRGIFCDLEIEELLNQHSQTDIMCLSYIYLPRIQRSLSHFQTCWNHHSLSSVSNATPNQLWLSSLMRLGYEKDIVSLRLVPEHIDLGFQSVDNIPQQVNLDFSRFGLEPDAIDYFISVARELVPDPLIDDNQEGKTLYVTLRSYLLNQ